MTSSLTAAGRRTWKIIHFFSVVEVCWWGNIWKWKKGEKKKVGTHLCLTKFCWQPLTVANVDRQTFFVFQFMEFFTIFQLHWEKLSCTKMKPYAYMMEWKIRIQKLKNCWVKPANNRNGKTEKKTLSFVNFPCEFNSLDESSRVDLIL